MVGRPDTWKRPWVEGPFHKLPFPQLTVSLVLPQHFNIPFLLSLWSLFVTFRAISHPQLLAILLFTLGFVEAFAQVRTWVNSF